MWHSLLVAAILFAQVAGQSAMANSLPAVDTNVRKKTGDWIGKRLSEIIPTDHISKIIRVHEYQLDIAFLSKGRYGGQKEIDAAIQKGYDKLVADLLTSDEKATQDFIYSYERVRAELVISTDDGKLFFVEVIGGLRDSVSGIAVYNSDGGVRIPVANYKPATGSP